jgi:hypothetical protein
VDRIHGQAAGFVGGARESFEVQVHRRKEAAERRRRLFEVKNARPLCAISAKMTKPARLTNEPGRLCGEGKL